MNPLPPIPFLLLLALLSTGTALGQTPPKSDGSRTVPEVAVEAGRASGASGGLRAFVDPETGEITANPTPEQLRDLNQVIRQRRLTERSAAILRQGYLPGFGNAVQLGPRLYSSAVAVPGAQGPILQCSQGEDPLRAAHAAPASEAAPTGPIPGLETDIQ